MADDAEGIGIRMALWCFREYPMQSLDMREKPGMGGFSMISPCHGTSHKVKYK
jgi:hypothetical protein